MDPFLVLTPTLAAGVLALVRFVGCDRVLGFEPVAPPPPPRSQIVAYTIDPNSPPTIRNDFSGWVGMEIVPAADQTLLSLGRWCLLGNSQAHQVKVVDASTSMDVAGAIVTIPLVNRPENTFVFVDLPSPVMLAASQMYYILSQEQSGGDDFLDFGITVTPSPDFQVPIAIFGDPTASPPTPYTTEGGPGNCYGPVNAEY
jgi:hypothetical protein